MKMPYTFKKKTLIICALLAVCLWLTNCSKNGKELTARNQLVEKMAHDDDVQAYYQVINKQTGDLGMLLAPSKQELDYHVQKYREDTTYRVPKKTQAEITEAVKRAAPKGQAEFLVKQAQKINEKYGLQNKTEAEVKDIFEKVFKTIDENKLIRPKKLEGRKKSENEGLSMNEMSPDGTYVVSYASYEEPDLKPVSLLLSL